MLAYSFVAGVIGHIQCEVAQRSELGAPAHDLYQPPALVIIDPGGRRPALLDHIYPTSWAPDWTVEAIDLLTVLTRLVELEPAQAGTLAHIVAGDQLSEDDLRIARTRWPVSRQDRKPRFSYDNLSPNTAPGNQGTLT